MSPKAAHNALAAAVEMYAEALGELTQRNAALMSQLQVLQKEIETIRTESETLKKQIKKLEANGVETD
jgi:cell division protein FtsB